MMNNITNSILIGPGAGDFINDGGEGWVCLNGNDGKILYCEQNIKLATALKDILFGFEMHVVDKTLKHMTHRNNVIMSHFGVNPLLLSVLEGVERNEQD